MKKYLSLIISLLIILSTSVFAYAADTTSIVCVGDGVTYNADNALYNYTFYLETELGEGNTVYNCAKSGATLSSYLTSDEYSESLSYGADKVIVMFGADDTVSATDKDSFYSAYSSLIDSYSGAEIILMLPPVVSDELKAAASDVAREKNLKLIDLTKAVNAVNIYDTYYVNAAGAKQITAKITEFFEINALGLKLDIDVINKLDKSGNSSGLTVTNTFAESETVEGKEIDYVYFNREGSSTTEVFSFFNANAASVMSEEGSFTVEMWAKITNSDENDRLLFAVAPKSLTSFANASFYISVNGNDMTVSSGGESSVIDITSYADKWVHWVIERSYDADNGSVNIDLYADTQKVCETITFSQTRADESEMKLYFGGMGTSRKKCLDNIFRGYLAEARVYDSALSSDIVTELYNRWLANFEAADGEDNEDSSTDPEQPPLNPDEPVNPDGKYTIVTIGDSITFNTNNSNQDYPLYLQNLVGNSALVYNCGMSGSTVNSNIMQSYRINAMEQYQDSLEHLAEMYIIMMGTNDSHYWNSKEVFYEEYKSLVEEYENLASNPEIVLVTSPTAHESETWGDHFDDELIGGDIRDVVYQIAEEKGLAVIDMHTLTKDKSALFHDGIHPNENGAEFIAEQIYAEISKLHDFIPEEEPEKEKGLVFELTIPEEKDGAFGDSVDETVKVSKNGSTTVETYSGVGGTFNYVSLDNASKNKASWLTVDVKNIINSEELTFEIWTRPENLNLYWGNMFSFTNNSNPTYSMMRIGCWENKFAFCGQTTNATTQGDWRADGTSYVGKWTHIIFQRSYDDSEKTVSYAAYINGNKFTTQVAAYDEKPVESEAVTILGIGGVSSNAQHAYKGDISEFRIYNMLLSETEIKASYEKDLERHTDFAFYYKGTGVPARDSESITMEMSTGFSALDALQGPIAVTENDNAVTAQVTAIDESKFSLTFNRYIKYGASFRIYSEYFDAYNYLTFDKGVISANLTLYDENIEEIESVGGQSGLVANVNIKNSGSEDKKVKYSLLAKKSDGVVLHYITDELTVSKSKNLPVNLSDTADVDKVILYVWEIDENKLIPAYDIPIIID